MTAPKLTPEQMEEALEIAREHEGNTPSYRPLPALARALIQRDEELEAALSAPAPEAGVESLRAALAGLLAVCDESPGALATVDAVLAARAALSRVPALGEVRCRDCKRLSTDHDEDGDCPAPAPNLTEGQAAIELLCGYIEEIESHGAGAFDSDCDICVALGVARSSLSRLEARVKEQEEQIAGFMEGERLWAEEFDKDDDPHAASLRVLRARVKEVEGLIGGRAELAAKQLIACLDCETDISEADERRIAEAFAAAESRLSKMRGLLQRIHGWDHMDTAADGPYWRREIRAVLALPSPPADHEEKKA